MIDDPACHPEPIRFAQGKLREGALGKLREGACSVGTEMLRCAQHDKVPQHDKVGLFSSLQQVMGCSWG
jgi:hypothetical protein